MKQFPSVLRVPLAQLCVRGGRICEFLVMVRRDLTKWSKLPNGNGQNCRTEMVKTAE